jgi:hypothetical protein
MSPVLMFMYVHFSQLYPTLLQEGPAFQRVRGETWQRGHPKDYQR